MSRLTKDGMYETSLLLGTNFSQTDAYRFVKHLLIQEKAKSYLGSNAVGSMRVTDRAVALEYINHGQEWDYKISNAVTLGAV